MHLKFLIASLFLLAVPALIAQESPVPTKPPAKVNKRPSDKPENPSEPFDKASVEEMTKCVLLDTAEGVIELEMFPFTAPNTVRNFLNLTAIGAFDNTTFSRVVPKFVIQGGDLYTNENITYEMSVRAHKKLADEPNIVKHERGIISMARGDEPDSASTSFFILVDDADYLDDKFAAFGKVVKGMALVDLINEMPVEDEAPKKPVLVSKATIKACDVVKEEKVQVVQPAKSPKVNDLPGFGLRGAVKSVQVTSFDKKGNKTMLDSSSWAWTYSEAELTFEEDGQLSKTKFFDENNSFLRTETYLSPVTVSGKLQERIELMKDPSGKLLREIVYHSRSDGSLEFKAFSGEKNLNAVGEITNNESGRALSVIWERFTDDGKSLGKFKRISTYDAYGFEATRVESDENTPKKTTYYRYEYTDFDDHGNWLERSVFDSEKAKNPLRTEKRVISYYQ